MIVYLGMPRCASSWLYNQIGQADAIKETHHLYTNPINLEEYCQSRILDFSTNNWSMDSDVVKYIDPYVTHYILVLRDPIELAISYKTLFNDGQSLDDFVSTLITNKLLCYGDIIERWYNLVDPSKILIFSYDQIVEDNVGFVTALTKQINMPVPEVISQIRTNISQNKPNDTVSDANRTILQAQVAKANAIINTRLFINNK